MQISPAETLPTTLLLGWKRSLIAPVTARPVSGGFSGARIWQITTGARQFALRQWPAAGPNLSRLQELHRLLGCVATPDLPPQCLPIPTDTGSTWLEWPAEPDESADQPVSSHPTNQRTLNQRLWQLEPWLRGESLGSAPAPAALHATMQALARWHRRAALYRCTPHQQEQFGVRVSPSPALQERLASARHWNTPNSLPSPEIFHHLPEDMRALLTTAALVVRSRLTDLVTILSAWQTIPLPLQPCLRDVWHDHILLEGSTITGLIDPWAARTECVVTDLARLLGSLELAPLQWNEALQAYQEIRPLSEIETRALPVFFQSSVILSLGHWVNRLSNRHDQLLQQHRQSLFPDELIRVRERIANYLQQVMKPTADAIMPIE